MPTRRPRATSGDGNGPRGGRGICDLEDSFTASPYCERAGSPANHGPVTVSARLRRRIEHDFPGAADEVELLLEAVESGNQEPARVLAAVVFIACGDVARLTQAISMSQQDWRDVLVGGGLADADWASVLDARLGPLVS